MKNALLLGIGALVAVALFSPAVLKEGEGRVHIPIFFDQPAPKLLFVGDIMLDRSVARFIRREGSDKLFDDVKETFGQHDLVVGNLEGTLTTNPSVSEVDNTILRFTFDPALANTLYEAGIGMVSLANNHALDFGEFGFDDTHHYLREAGISYFGSPFNELIDTSVQVRDKKLCFVGYHELYRRDSSKVVGKIVELEPTCDRTIVFAHWGVEYEHVPNSSQKELAHLFVDNGADLIIGAHPHVVQTFENYNDVGIFYSIGNFVFDQGWKPDVRRGVMVSVEFGNRETIFNLLPVNTYLEATPANEEVSAAVLADLGIEKASFSIAK